ncbi:hypothetical protein VULLAG_LOCUS15573 [Vulpes lagopus]
MIFKEKGTKSSSGEPNRLFKSIYWEGALS